jgi:hypothetical protein
MAMIIGTSCSLVFVKQQCFVQKEELELIPWIRAQRSLAQEESLNPFVPCFLPLISTMSKQSRCSTSQFVPLRVENNLKSVKQ